MGKRSRSTIKVRESNSTQTLKKLPLRMIGAWGIIIILITFLMYVPALKNDFVNWDDDAYVYKNTYIHSLHPQAIAWMLTAFHVGNWHPLTWLSHAADYAVWGLNPFGHHLTSIILHGLNTFSGISFDHYNSFASKKSMMSRHSLPPPIPFRVCAVPDWCRYNSPVVRGSPPARGVGSVGGGTQRLALRPFLPFDAVLLSFLYLLCSH